MPNNHDQSTLPPLEEVASYIGRLYAAAAHDLASASPSDVGLDGVSVIGWRQGYVEGCKDMAEGIVTRLPATERDRLKPIMLAAFQAEAERLRGERVNAWGAGLTKRKIKSAFLRGDAGFSDAVPALMFDHGMDHGEAFRYLMEATRAGR